MKYITTILLLLISLQFAKAQKHEVIGFENVTTANDSNTPSYKVNGVLDTLKFHWTRAVGFTIFSASNGYIFGTGADSAGNRYSESIGMYFDSVGNITITNVYFWMARKRIVGGANTVDMQLHVPGPDSLPVSLQAFGSANLGFLDTASSANVNTFLGFASIPLSLGSPVVNGPFCITLNYNAIDDTLGLVSNQQNDGFGERRAYMLAGSLFGGGFVKIADFWNIMGAPMDVDPLIIPVVEHASVVALEDRIFSSKNFTFRAAYPSPADEVTSLKYWLQEEDDIVVSVIDESGRTVYDSGKMHGQKGEYSHSIHVGDWAAGIYFYSVSSSKGSITSRLIVAH